jgi:hypothetical protein
MKDAKKKTTPQDLFGITCVGMPTYCGAMFSGPNQRVEFEKHVHEAHPDYVDLLLNSEKEI